MFLLFCIFLNLKYNKERGDKMETYNMLIDLLKKYFKNRNIKDIFCYGGCFYFASKIKENIPNTSIWWNRKLMHCAIYFEDNNGLYDITGRINKNGFVKANEKDLLYMQKHFKPNFDEKQLDIYIQQNSHYNL